MLVSELVTFLSKKNSGIWISHKMLKKNIYIYSLTVFGPLCGEKPLKKLFIPF